MWQRTEKDRINFILHLDVLILRNIKDWIDIRHILSL